MPRRRDEGIIEIFLGAVAAAPWWVGVLLAGISFGGLSWYIAGGPPVPDPKDPFATLYFRLASIARWLVPALCVIGAGVSAIRQERRRALHSHVGAGGSRASLAQMSWREFEMLVGEYFRRRGFAMTETGGGGPDGGVDLVLHKGADRYVVQCKQWRAMNVGVATVRELYGVLAASRAAGGYVVTAGRFTAEAKRFAEGTEITLIDGDELARAVAEQAGASVAEPVVATGQGAVSCPSCGSTMLKRRATRGANAGREFWGCSTYPRCRGTRAV